MLQEEDIGRIISGVRLPKSGEKFPEIETTAAQQETLHNYNRSLTIRGRSFRTRVAYLRWLVQFITVLGSRRFEEVTQEDFRTYLYSLREKKPSTRSNAYIALHSFYRWLGESEGEDTHDKYTRILERERYKVPAGERHFIKAEELPTEEEVLRIIKYAPSARDKAMIAMTYDLGTRPHELLNLDINDVAFDEYGAVITVGEHGKTGARTVRPIFSLPYIREWLEGHPFRDNPKAPLFIQQGARNYGGRPTVQTLRRAFQNAAKLAGVTGKRLYTYKLRHASITREAGNGLGDQELKCFFGWVQDSKMLRVYSHLTSEDVNRKRLEQAGILKAKEKKRELGFQKCPRCGAENPVTHEYCNKCASPLDETRYRELMNREQEIKALREELEKARGVDLEQLKAQLLADMPKMIEQWAAAKVTTNQKPRGGKNERRSGAEETQA